MSKWISVKEKLPEDNIVVLWFSKKGYQFTGRRDGDCINFGPIYDNNGDATVTHWMNLPLNPTGEE